MRFYLLWPFRFLFNWTILLLPGLGLILLIAFCTEACDDDKHLFDIFKGKRWLYWGGL
jgi:hypothetical protein